MSKVLVYYPGHHGGPVVAQLRSGRPVRFEPHTVRRVPEQDAADLISPPPIGGGYCEALPLAEIVIRFGLTAADVDERRAAGGLTLATYQEEDAGEPAEVVVLDRATLDRLKPAAPASPEPVKRKGGSK